MLTLAQLTGAAVVLATFHVTFWLVSTVHVAALLGAVTAKGPASVVHSDGRGGIVHAAAAVACGQTELHGAVDRRQRFAAVAVGPVQDAV